jgi:hypothetical protein
MSAYSQILFLNTYTASGCVGCNGDPNCVDPGPYGLIYVEGTDLSVQAQILTAAESFDWNQTPPPVPNIAGLIAAVKTEPTFNAQIRTGLGGLCATLLATGITYAQQEYNDAVETYGSTWLTPAVQATLLAYFVQFNIPIVAAS